MYRFIVYLLQPHIVLFLVVCVATGRLWRKRRDPRRRWWPLVVPLIALAVISTPAVAHLALLSLETYAPPLEDRPPDAEAIVIFAAGTFPPEGPRVRAEMSEHSLHRCLHGAWLYARGAPCPV